MIQLTKLEAARRQLRVAIEMLFEGGDPVAVHTLVGAASVIITDLIEYHAPDRSWDTLAQDANNLSASEYFRVMRKQQNFLKHARDDPAGVLEFDPVDTESVAFWTVMNLGALVGTLSIEESVLQLWYIACHAPNPDPNIPPYALALEFFGDIRAAPRAKRLAAGKRVLAEQLAEGPQP